MIYNQDVNHYLISTVLKISSIKTRKQMSKLFIIQGRPQDLGGEGKNFFFRFGNLHVGEAMRIASGVRGHAPPRNFLKRCNLVRFRAYFDQILYLFFFQKLPFFI